MHKTVKSIGFNTLKLTKRFIYALHSPPGKDILVTDYHSFYERVQIAKSRKLVAGRCGSTGIRLDVEQNQIVSVANAEWGFEIVCRQARKIYCFSRMDTEGICGQV